MQFNVMGLLCPGSCRAAIFKHSTLVFAMRVSFVYVLMGLCSITMLWAEDVSGQSLDTIRVTVELNNETLPQLFDKIQAQTGLLFGYRQGEVDQVEPFTLARQTTSVKAILDVVLLNTNLQYKQVNNNVLVFEKKHEPLGTQLAIIPITGTVKDNAGNSMAGVNIGVKGMSLGTTTDAQGQYSLDVAAGPGEADIILVFSFIGYKTIEVPVASRILIDVTMEEDANILQEVEINAGYYKVNNTTKTGSIARLSSKEIEKQPVSNPLQALQGRLPGVYVTQTSGTPGSSFLINIRGLNSLSGANQPLFMIDGVQYTNTSLVGIGHIAYGVSPFNNIDPASIESIEVLKDADATAIYGSQGANGVVLVTTKKAKAGKTAVTVNFSSGFSRVPHFIKLLNTQDYLTMRKEALANDGLVAGQIRPDYDLLQWDTTRYTNWQKVLLGGTERRTNADVSVSGGSGNTRFLLRGSFLKQTTVYPGDFAYTRGAGHFNLIHDSPGKKFQLVFTTDVAGDKNDLPFNHLIVEALQLAPNAPRLYTEDGQLNWENNTWNNPLAQLTKKYLAKTRSIFLNSTVSYEIIPGLKLKTTIGYNILQMREIATWPMESINPAQRDVLSGISFSAWTGTDTWSAEPQVEFKKKIWVGELEVLTGTTFRQSLRNEDALQGFNRIDALLENLRFASSVQATHSTATQYKYAALYGRINYNIAQKYIINLTARRDGSSRFGPNNKFANFGALGAAWIFSNENFMKRTLSGTEGWLSFGKLRGSFGITGSDQIGDYQYLQLYSPINAYQGYNTGFIPTQISNANYSWENVQKLEAAMELGFMNDRIELEVDFYRNQSSKQLVGESVPGMTGFQSFLNNSRATIQNQGWEFELSTVNFSTGVFQWTTAVNLTLPTSKLVSYPNIENSSDAYVYEVGKSPYMIKRVHYTGVNPQTGIYQFEDKDNDGSSFGNGDRQALILHGRKYFGGVQNVIRYGDFELSFQIQFTKQNGQNYLNSAFEIPGIGSRFGSAGGNQPAFVMNRWQQPGQHTSIQKFTTSEGTAAGDVYTRRSMSDMIITDASFIRLQNASFSWKVPKKWLSKARITEASLYIQGQNLYTITNYFGFDPQSANFNTLPPLRTITIGAKISL